MLTPTTSMPVETLPMTATERAQWIQLSALEAVKRQDTLRALREAGLPSRLFAQSEATLARQFGERFATALHRPPNARLRAAIDAAHAWHEGAGHHIVTLADPAYPARLLTLADPPLLLYVAGRLDLLNRAAVAVVGSRAPTQQGLENASLFAGGLALAGWTVVSGLALGVDAQAHKAALHAAANGSAGTPDSPSGAASLDSTGTLAVGAAVQSASQPGSTIAVIGTGIDRVYPSDHRALSAEIAKHGAVISEWPLGTAARRSHFPQRNRLIAALTQGVLVVEATVRSGSLITARIANEIGRDVFAIPGSIHSPLARGCHALIKDGAKLVEELDDILDELPWQGPGGKGQRPGTATRTGTAAETTARRPPRKPRPDRPATPAPVATDVPAQAPWQHASQPAAPRHTPRQTTLWHAEEEVPADPMAARVLVLLAHDPATPDTLAARGCLSAASISAALSHLDMDGWVEQRGGRYQRTTGRRQT